MDILELKNISYQKNTETILQDINLTVPENTSLTISGPSGGGKSTLLKLIASLLTPTTGTILFAGEKQQDYPITEYRQRVSYCFQQPVLIGNTVYDNLVFPFQVRNQVPDKERMLQSLKQVALPNHYLDKKIIELSGGEKQRVALLRNIIFLPDILLLDEVTTGLDEVNRNIVRELIASIYQKNVSILSVTHNAAEIKQAKNILWMKGGHITDESISSQ